MRHWQRLLVLSASCIVATACGVSTADEEGRDAAISVQQGRLLFRDMTAFADMIREFNGVSPGLAGGNRFQSRFPEFQALGAEARANPELAGLLQQILDRNYTYQIGDQIFLFRGDVEYQIPSSESQLVAVLSAGGDASPYLAAGTIQAHRREHIGAPVAGDDSVASVLNAKYQHTFWSAPQFKFVDETYLDFFSTYVQSCFRSKLEYRDGNNWRAAGEQVAKAIKNAEVEYSFTTTSTNDRFTAVLPSLGQIDNTNLTLCFVVPATRGGCLQEFQLRADFTSRMESGKAKGSQFNVPGAHWDTEYTTLSRCY
jgi:hypothetical protein